MRLSLLLFSLCLPSTIVAYGGIFGRKAPNQVVTDSGDSIIFALSGDNKVQLQVQLQYDNANQGDSFGWILPIPALPTKLEVGSSLLFNALFQETLPKFVLDIQPSGSNSASTARSQAVTSALGEPCAADVLANQNCPVQGPTRSASGSVTVWAEGHAGVAQYKVLEGNKAAVMEWLQSNQWATDGPATGGNDLDTLLDFYDAYGSVYVVLQANPSTTSGALQPILIEYEQPPTAATGVHRVPTLLSAASPRTLQVYFLTDEANTRAVPINYLDVTLDDRQVDWVGCLEAAGGMDSCYYKDYQRRYRNAIKSVTNQTMTTEYYGSDAKTLLGNKIAIDIAPATLETSANWLDYLHELETAGLPPIPEVQSILDLYIPPKESFLAVPPFQCAQWEHVYQPFRTVSPSMNDCYEIFNPPPGWQWDPIGLTAALEANVLAPARAAQILVDTRMTSLTRLYGELMAPTKTPEPHFILTPNLPEVDNVHRATALPLCDIGSPSALEITLSASDQATTFWQPAILSCPTWAKTSPQPVLDPTETAGKVTSLASLFTAWGGPNNNAFVVSPNGEGAFSNDDINAALDYGDASLVAVTDGNAGGGPSEGEFPSIPQSGTTYIDLNNVEAFESTNYHNNNGAGQSGSVNSNRRNGFGDVGAILLMAVMVMW